MSSFPTWGDGSCGGCGHEQAKDDEEPHYKFECTSECGYEGCPECMPLGRGSNCKECVDPVTGE